MVEAAREARAMLEAVLSGGVGTEAGAQFRVKALARLGRLDLDHSPHRV
jgi:hypothetical protein